MREVGRVVGMSTGHEYISGIHGSCIMSYAADVLGMSVMRGMKGVGGVCEMCLARDSVGGEGCVDKRIGFGLYQSCWSRGSVGRISVFGLRWCGWYRWGVGKGRGPES